jgi:hypothetical protein
VVPLTRRPFSSGTPVEVDVVVEDLPEVVGDDVDDHLDAAPVARVDQLAQRRQVAEVRVEPLQVDLPVAVVPVDPGVGVDVEHDGADPERGDPERLEVVQPIDDPLASLRPGSGARSPGEVRYVVGRSRRWRSGR